jgi:hypothetical protein
MVEICRKIEESLDAVIETCSPVDFAAYLRAVGKVVAPFVFEVLEPLDSDHPAL